MSITNAQIPGTHIFSFQYPELDGRRRKRRPGSDGATGNPDIRLSKIRNACNACREKKTRCSGHEPCVRCQQNGQTCEYMPTVSTPQKTPRSSRASKRKSVSVPSPTITAISHESRMEDLTVCSPIIPVGSSTSSSREVDESPPDASLQEDQYGHVHGGASEFAFLQFAKQKLASVPSMSIDFCDYPLTSPAGPNVMPPKQIADLLLQTFFNFGLSTSRFIHQPSLTEDYEKLYDPASTAELGTDKLALIYMVMAVGSHYSTLQNMWCGYSASVQFYHMADQQLQKGTSRISIASLQSRLLITHYLLNHSRTGPSKEISKGASKFDRAGNRKRLFWAIYIHDRILSSIFGRPCALHDDDIDQEEATLANDVDITTTSCQSSPETHFLYGPESRGHSIQELHKVALTFESKLTAWKGDLPTYLDYTKLPASAMSTMTQRQTCTLKLTFSHASLLLYRPFILYSLEASVEKAPNLQGWIKRCHDKSIDAANTIVAECKYLAERGLFSRVFYLVTYLQFAAIGTLFMYCHLWPNASEARSTAEEARMAFPAGVEGDLVGQRYVEVLNELSKLTSVSSMDLASGHFQGAQLDDLAFNFESVPVDLAGPWSNLFFDPTMFDEYLGFDMDGAQT
uniref:Zn(2)-C6 fungal-type domain-containing protein n=1 Tax=Bionectria ochroleuca TaxID=29856 RepID=A0A8H7N3U9_BIOOC